MNSSIVPLHGKKLTRVICAVMRSQQPAFGRLCRRYVLVGRAKLETPCGRVACARSAGANGPLSVGKPGAYADAPPAEVYQNQTQTEPSTTPSDATPRSTIFHPGTTRGGTTQPRTTKALNRPSNRGNFSVGWSTVGGDTGPSGARHDPHDGAVRPPGTPELEDDRCKVRQVTIWSRDGERRRSGVRISAASS